MSNLSTLAFLAVVAGAVVVVAILGDLVRDLVAMRHADRLAHREADLELQALLAVELAGHDLLAVTGVAEDGQTFVVDGVMVSAETERAFLELEDRLDDLGPLRAKALK